MASKSTMQVVGKTVGTTGFGMLRLNAPNGPTTEEAIPVMKAALEQGCNFWNAAEYYGSPEYNSLHLLKSYFTKYPEDAEKVVLSVKGGYKGRMPDGTPEGIRRSVDTCNSILAGTKLVDIFILGRVDKNVPIETSMATMKELVDEGKIGALGLSEVGVEKIERALKVAPLAAVELEVSVMSREIFQNGVSELCAKNNILVIGYCVLGRGQLLFQSPKDVPSIGLLSAFPRFHPEAMETNMKFVLELRKVAEAKGCSMAQFCISWVKHMSKRGGNAEILPIPGCTSVARAQENAVDVELSEEDMQQIDAILDSHEVVGGRYPDQLASTWEM